MSERTWCVHNNLSQGCNEKAYFPYQNCDTKTALLHVWGGKCFTITSKRGSHGATDFARSYDKDSHFQPIEVPSGW